MKVLFKNVDLYTPKHIGLTDVLINGDKVEKIDKKININCETVDCQGKILCPMFVDGHEHLTIKSVSYSPDGIINSGVNTVVGVLAGESGKNDVEDLINRTKLLREKHNIDAYCLAGSKNFAEDTTKYILDNDFVVGIKTALFTSQRPKPNLSYEKLKADAISTYNAGRKSKKNVQVHIHLDHPFARGESMNIEEINSGKIDNLWWIDKIVEETEVPYSLFKLTHSEKYHDRILEYANKGVYLDYTATHKKDENKYNSLIYAINSKKYDLSKFSISSDLGILTLERGFIGEETPFTLLNTIKLLISKGISFEEVILLVTTNALAPITKKEELIYVGSNCKFLVINNEFEIQFCVLNGKIQFLKEQNQQRYENLNTIK